MYIRTKLGVVVLLSENTKTILRSSTKILIRTAIYFKEARVSL